MNLISCRSKGIHRSSSCCEHAIGSPPKWMDVCDKCCSALVQLVTKIMGCFGSCLGFGRKTCKVPPKHASFTRYKGGASQEHLLRSGGDTSGRRSGTSPSPSDGNGWCEQNGHFVKLTYHADTSQDHAGNKMINQYVRKQKIGKGSYGKVVLHWSLLDHKFYAIKVFDKPRLRKIRVAPAETAMMDVQREVEVMKRLNHPNIVKLIEVIDDPECDQLYMVLEYLEGQRMFEGPGRPGGLGESTVRSYFKDIVSGLMYLHSKNVIHGDIKPENLMITANGTIKIGDFGISRTFEDDDDLLRRSPGTPVFTAPECCKGMNYHGKAADVWALGVTLYCMAVGQYPFVGESFQDTYDKIVQQDLVLPPDMDPDLRDLLEKLLCKDPDVRITLKDVCSHPWVVRGVDEELP